MTVEIAMEAWWVANPGTPAAVDSVELAGAVADAEQAELVQMSVDDADLAGSVAAVSAEQAPVEHEGHAVDGSDQTPSIVAELTLAKLCTLDTPEVVAETAQLVLARTVVLVAAQSFPHPRSSATMHPWAPQWPSASNSDAMKDPTTGDSGDHLVQLPYLDSQAFRRCHSLLILPASQAFLPCVSVAVA